jgi:hypothetical protein
LAQQNADSILLGSSSHSAAAGASTNKLCARPVKGHHSLRQHLAAHADQLQGRGCLVPAAAKICVVLLHSDVLQQNFHHHGNDYFLTRTKALS